MYRMKQRQRDYPGQLPRVPAALFTPPFHSNLVAIERAGYNRFLPISRLIQPDRVPDPHNVRLELLKNGQVVQNDNTNLMLFKIPELLVAITDVMDLHVGDLVLSISRCFLSLAPFPLSGC